MMEIIVTKKAVKKIQPKLYAITLNLTCKEGLVEVLNQDFSEHYRTGQNVAEIVNDFKIKMQEAINDYKEEQQIFSTAQLDNAVVALKNGLV